MLSLLKKIASREPGPLVIFEAEVAASVEDTISAEKSDDDLFLNQDLVQLQYPACCYQNSKILENDE